MPFPFIANPSSDFSLNQHRKQIISDNSGFVSQFQVSNINAKSDEGKTALDYAREEKNSDAVKIPEEAVRKKRR